MCVTDFDNFVFIEVDNFVSLRLIILGFVEVDNSVSLTLTILCVTEVDNFGFR